MTNNIDNDLAPMANTGTVIPPSQSEWDFHNSVEAKLGRATRNQPPAVGDSLEQDYKNSRYPLTIRTMSPIRALYCWLNMNRDEEDPLTLRSFAAKMGITLGLVNRYMDGALPALSDYVAARSCSLWEMYPNGRTAFVAFHQRFYNLVGEFSGASVQMGYAAWVKWALKQVNYPEIGFKNRESVTVAEYETWAKELCALNYEHYSHLNVAKILHINITVIRNWVNGKTEKLPIQVYNIANERTPA